MGENAKEDDAVGFSLVSMHFVQCVYHHDREEFTEMWRVAEAVFRRYT